MTRLDDLFDRFPEHLSVEQLAQVLGVTKPTAYRWLQQGDIPAYKVGGGVSGRANWVIVRDEVRDHLIANRNTTGAGEVDQDQE
ncbi:helix-turn-helix domain-containing protein [Actinotalea sp. C106]|uniref:helix-turn-helix domain-containing protein n=1 Tax=Actinotalea sp. C106 TaxID=2908644 RepID=UPI0027E1744F|nr:helix-turn-helix domain-containing protein [Actinotalea sp. C106]